ncbi:MAG TPA: metalloregulator ArsR/SmtB family transcription factor [Candidatus Limnocylindria bacterium]|nr:metalloregulator ArsR/SmtB family transcription factor [Candidatus Limnocylindria bacterium]
MDRPLHRFKSELFKTLGHPLRIHILELLRGGEVSVRELLSDLDVEPSTASQQLGVLRAGGIVDSRRADGTVYYRMRDPLIAELLDVGRRVFGKQVLDLQHVLAAQKRAEGQLRKRPVRGLTRASRTSAKR